MNHFSDSACTVRSIVSICDRLGVDKSGVLEAAGLKPQSLEDPHARVPFEQMEAVWKAGYLISKDPCLALHAAESVQYGAYGVVDFVCAAAATVGAAIQRLCWYFPLINNGVMLAAEKGEQACALYLGSPVGRLPPPTIDFIFATILVHSRQCWGLDWAPRRVEFPYRKPEDLKEYDRIFRCRFTFQTPISRMVIPRVFWDTPLPGANLALLNVLEDHATTLLALHPPPLDWEARIRGLIGSRLREGGPALRMVAREMGFSPRSLQRKLSSINRTYAQILDEMRAQMSKHYLRDPDIPVGEIADSVGYQEISSFTRAFKRWTGTTPTHYRKSIINPR
jgi:AraC-like DNA-binding protein